MSTTTQFIQGQGLDEVLQEVKRLRRHLEGRTWRLRLSAPAKASQLDEDLVERLTVNELHDEVVQAVLFADTMHRHDVRVV